VKYAVALVGVCAVLGTSSSSYAVINEFEEGKKQKEGERDVAAAATVKTGEKVAWRNSLVTYENIFSAYSIDRGAQLSYNPYYAQSISFLPRYYPRDDLYLRARLDLEIELTTSDDTDYAREWIVSDLYLDVDYKPAWMTIPVVDVMVNPSLRLMFPTSIVSRGRSMMLGLAPGVALRRSFKLLDGKFLKSVGLLYGFRATKYFHEYTTAQVSSRVCIQTRPDDPSCTQADGLRNRSWRFVNTVGVQLALMDKLLLSGTVLFINDLLYELPEGEHTFNDMTVHVDGTDMNHRASTWAIFDLSYDLLDWLWLSAGVSTYYPQLAPDSTYRTPMFNRYTTFYFDVTLPVDRFVSQVRSWTGS
jgi:hypothetical protein